MAYEDIGGRILTSSNLENADGWFLCFEGAKNVGERSLVYFVPLDCGERVADFLDADRELPAAWEAVQRLFIYGEKMKTIHIGGPSHIEPFDRRR